jgi:hypothetical protein
MARTYIYYQQAAVAKNKAHVVAEKTRASHKRGIEKSKNDPKE